MSATCARIQPILLSVLRIVTAYLFLLHGTSKFFGFPTSMGGGSPEGLMLVAGILEIVGGILLILGLFTRPAAFILSGQMAAAISWHTPPKVRRCSRLPTAANRQYCSASCSSISQQPAAAHWHWTTCSAKTNPDRPKGRLKTSKAGFAHPLPNPPTD